MAAYRVRIVFRVLAGVLAMPALAFGVLGLVSSISGFHIVPFALGLLALALGALFSSVALTGRVPAAVEEYGLDDVGEVEALRAKMTRLRRFLS